MARGHLRHNIKDAAGNAVQNALINVYLIGTVTPVTDMFAALSAGSAITTLTSNAQGEVEAYFDTPKKVDLLITDNTDTAFYPSVAGVLTWTNFTETVEVFPPPDEIATTSTVAPVGADYLVGTANATLTNEIVVGATPGGELGGTWALPTVDATHSGSTHAAVQAAAEATAASALTTHAGAVDPHTGYVLESLMGAAGTLFKGTGVGTLAGLVRGTANQVLKTNAGGTDIEWGSGGVGDLLNWKFVRKTANESVTSSITLQNDDHLFFSIAANEIWAVAYHVFVGSGAEAADIYFEVTGPAGMAARWGFFGPTGATTDPTTASIHVRSADEAATYIGDAGIDDVNPVYATVNGLVVNGATAGTIQLQWAQNVSNATATTVLTNSHLIARRVA